MQTLWLSHRLGLPDFGASAAILTSLRPGDYDQLTILRSPSFLWAGLLGTLICCFTPVLVGLFGLVGLGAVTGYLDYALMPLLGFFIGALTRITSRRSQARAAWATGVVALVGFAVLFGRGTPIFAVLIIAGAVLAFVTYRR